MGEEGESWAEAPWVGAVPRGGLWFWAAEKTVPEWEDEEWGAVGSSFPGFLSWPNGQSWPWARGGRGGGGLMLGSPSEGDLTSSCQKTQQE